MSQLPPRTDVIVIGAGASGLMCALTAGYRGRSVLLLEHTTKVGRKLLISGGGRCNFTHLHSTPEHFLSENPHFCRSALSRFGPRDFLEMVERHGIAHHEKAPGQLFCDGSAREILEMLLTEAGWAGVRIETGVTIGAVAARSPGFRVETSRGAVEAEAVVVATGGLSIPKAGATGFAYDLAQSFGLRLVERRAALVPFTLPPELLEPLQELSGVSQPARIRCAGRSFEESLLFTHRGLSGPAVLQISSFWTPGSEVEIDLLPGADLAADLRRLRDEHPRWSLERCLGEGMSKRLARALCAHWSLTGEVGQQSNARLEAVAAAFQRWRLLPAGTEGYRSAEVTRGGIDTDELSQRTFEAKKVPGLHLIGECVDVTGQLGGHNLQWAWSSGHCCGQAC
ncbi:MAG: NAD(P)/FAD-dependent oxidoreductase [Deltaproteobacteria bacterium]|nr:NAD(P)/FAD-dependent oxidoreductase [Deltaproteobacteria bacterium]